MANSEQQDASLKAAATAPEQTQSQSQSQSHMPAQKPDQSTTVAPTSTATEVAPLDASLVSENVRGNNPFVSEPTSPEATAAATATLTEDEVAFAKNLIINDNPSVHSDPSSALEQVQRLYSRASANSQSEQHWSKLEEMLHRARERAMKKHAMMEQLDRERQSAMEQSVHISAQVEDDFVSAVAAHTPTQSPEPAQGQAQDQDQAARDFFHREFTQLSNFDLASTLMQSKQGGQEANGDADDNAHHHVLIEGKLKQALDAAAIMRGSVSEEMLAAAKASAQAAAEALYVDELAAANAETVAAADIAHQRQQLSEANASTIFAPSTIAGEAVDASSYVPDPIIPTGVLDHEIMTRGHTNNLTSIPQGFCASANASASASNNGVCSVATSGAACGYILHDEDLTDEQRAAFYEEMQRTVQEPLLMPPYVAATSVEQAVDYDSSLGAAKDEATAQEKLVQDLGGSNSTAALSSDHDYWVAGMAPADLPAFAFSYDGPMPAGVTSHEATEAVAKVAIADHKQQELERAQITLNVVSPEYGYEAAPDQDAHVPELSANAEAVASVRAAIHKQAQAKAQVRARVPSQSAADTTVAEDKAAGTAVTEDAYKSQNTKSSGSNASASASTSTSISTSTSASVRPWKMGSEPQEHNPFHYRGGYLPCYFLYDYGADRFLLDEGSCRLIGITYTGDWVPSQYIQSQIALLDEEQFINVLFNPSEGNLIFTNVRITQGQHQGERLYMSGSVVMRDDTGIALLVAGYFSQIQAAFLDSVSRIKNHSSSFDIDTYTGEIHFGSAYGEMLGINSQDQLPRTVPELESRFVHPEDLLNYRKQHEVISNPKLGDYYETIYRIKHAGGYYIWCIDRGLVVERKRSGKASRVIGTTTNIDVVRSNFERLKRSIYQDPLTGLHNRLYLNTRYKFFTMEESQPLSLVYVDISGLKIINDYLGHSKGDELIKLAAHILQNEVYLDHEVVRLSGDEFLLIFINCSAVQCKIFINKFAVMLDARNREQEYPLPVFFGFGIATLHEIADGDTFLRCEARADQRLQEYKALHHDHIYRALRAYIERVSGQIITLDDKRRLEYYDRDKKEQKLAAAQEAKAKIAADMAGTVSDIEKSAAEADAAHNGRNLAATTKISITADENDTAGAGSAATGATGAASATSGVTASSTAAAAAEAVADAAGAVDSAGTGAGAGAQRGSVGAAVGAEAAAAYAEGGVAKGTRGAPATQVKYQHSTFYHVRQHNYKAVSQQHQSTDNYQSAAEASAAVFMRDFVENYNEAGNEVVWDTANASEIAYAQNPAVLHEDINQKQSLEGLIGYNTIVSDPALYGGDLSKGENRPFAMNAEAVAATNAADVAAAEAEAAAVAAEEDMRNGVSHSTAAGLVSDEESRIADAAMHPKYGAGAAKANANAKANEDELDLRTSSLSLIFSTKSNQAYFRTIQNIMLLQSIAALENGTASTEPESDISVSTKHTKTQAASFVHGLPAVTEVDSVSKKVEYAGQVYDAAYDASVAHIRNAQHLFVSHAQVANIGEKSTLKRVKAHASYSPPDNYHLDATYDLMDATLQDYSGIDSANISLGGNFSYDAEELRNIFEEHAMGSYAQESSTSYKQQRTTTKVRRTRTATPAEVSAWKKHKEQVQAAAAAAAAAAAQEQKPTTKSEEQHD